MKVLHVFPYEKFTQSFIDFIYENFELEKHYFIVFGYDKRYEINNLDSNEHIFHCRDLRELYAYKSLYKECKKIILHSCFKDIVLRVLFPYVKEGVYCFLGWGNLWKKKSSKNI